MEILGFNLEKVFRDSFEKDIPICGFKNDIYEVWTISKDYFDYLCNIPDEKWFEDYKESWWRYSSGCNLGYPNTTIHINNVELIGWGYHGEESSYEIHCDSLSDYLCNVLGCSTERNVCAVTVSIAKYNKMTLTDLFKRLEV